MSFLIAQGYTLSATLLNCVIEWILYRAGVQMSDLVYADDIVTLSSSHREMQELLEAVNRHPAAASMRIRLSMVKVMSALISGEQCTTVLLDGEPFEEVNLLRLDVHRKRINLARSAFPRPQTYL